MDAIQQLKSLAGVNEASVNISLNGTNSQEIKDLMGDSNHYAATIKSSQFNNLSKIEQHKLVYDALKGKMGG